MAALTRLTVPLALRHALALRWLSGVSHTQPQRAARLTAAVCQRHVSVPLTPAAVQERAGAQEKAEHLCVKTAVRADGCITAWPVQMLHLPRTCITHRRYFSCFRIVPQVRAYKARHVGSEAHCCAAEGCLPDIPDLVQAWDLCARRAVVNSALAVAEMQNAQHAEVGRALGELGPGRGGGGGRDNSP